MAVARIAESMQPYSGTVQMLLPKCFPLGRHRRRVCLLFPSNAFLSPSVCHGCGGAQFPLFQRIVTEAASANHELLLALTRATRTHVPVVGTATHTVNGTNHTVTTAVLPLGTRRKSARRRGKRRQQRRRRLAFVVHRLHVLVQQSFLVRNAVGPVVECSSVARVVCDGVAEPLQVEADLVRAAVLRRHLHQARRTVERQLAHQSNGFLCFLFALSSLLLCCDSCTPTAAANGPTGSHHRR
mmetsp:Transcript_27570/g.46726  ORF Transcript_27570/g.46726 Transcript_27570/m.46726 type:complete len:241 (-) Transcript_27570:176-898(-)